MKNFKKTAIAALSVLGYMGSVAAHDQNGSLGKTDASTDYYQVICFDDGAGDADHLLVQIKDMAPVAHPQVSVQVVKDISAKNATDAVDGNAAYSPTLNVKGVNGGNGAYYLIVDKTATGAETYSLQYHCLTSSGDHTGTNITILQNQ